ncbi:MAG: hypothetical protein RR472_04750, partial [Anaerovoracaceae bacterium]
MESSRFKKLNNRLGRAIGKALRNKSGELLIEGVLAFVILIIILGAATTILFTSTNMNRKAQTASANLEEAAKIIERGGGTELAQGKMKISLPGKTIEQSISIKEAEALTYFTPGGRLGQEGGEA